MLEQCKNWIKTESCQSILRVKIPTVNLSSLGLNNTNLWTLTDYEKLITNIYRSVFMDTHLYQSKDRNGHIQAQHRVRLYKKWIQLKLDHNKPYTCLLNVSFNMYDLTECSSSRLKKISIIIGLQIYWQNHHRSNKK